MTPVSADPQLPGLVRSAVRRTRVTTPHDAEPLALHDPIARVLVDVGLAHLDRDFDYAVPASLADQAVPGVRVKVRFAGREVNGYVVARVGQTPHPGRLTPIRRVVSPEPVLSPAILALAGRLAERYAGTRADVLRLAVPPRHARVEHEPPASPRLAEPVGRGNGAIASEWRHVPAAAAFLRHLEVGGSPRAVWTAAPGDDWPDFIARASAATYSGGRGVLILVPDGRDADRVDAALESRLGSGHHVVLRADAGPTARYRDFLAVSRGVRRVVVGTRAAAYAPVHEPGLLVIWDDGDDLYAEPRAPYPHAREVLMLRAATEKTAMLVGGFARSVESQALLSSHWARPMEVPRSVLRERVTVTATGGQIDPARDPHGHTARLPRVVFDAIRAALLDGPVLVQTPRSGYAPALACDRCRAPARCARCHGPLGLRAATSPPTCGWCAKEHAGWTCAACGGHGLRAPMIGGRRTSEELGRAFPGVPIRVSDGIQVQARVGTDAAIVVATPGAEPVAVNGYPAVVLLDAWLPLARTDLRADEEAVRRWLNAVGLVRRGGRALLVGASDHPAVQAVVRLDAAGFAERELNARAAAHLPPVAAVATLTGSGGALDDALTVLSLPESAEVLGPTPATGDELRVVLRVPRRSAPALAAALTELQRLRSARKLDPVRVQVDPPEL